MSNYNHYIFNKILCFISIEEISYSYDLNKLNY